MSFHSEDDELELKDGYSEGSKRSSDAEQEQGLLGGWKDEEDTVHGEAVPRPRRNHWSMKTCAAIVGAALLAVLITVGFVFWLHDVPEEQVGALVGVKTNDYVLDPAWDFNAPPQRREYHWVVRDQEHNPDGIYRPMMLVNDEFPGPLLELNEGDTVVVHVDNRAVNATSIHWHGLFQNGTPHMDGTVGITQCPIPPGGKFTYEFTVSGQSGTYWWHGHHGMQGSDGMHGPLIIHSRRETELQKIEYVTDRVVLISDHYHDLSSALLWQYLKPDAENTEPVPENGLINGRTVRDCDEFPGRKCNNSTSNAEVPTFDLAPNQNHRLRIINVGAFAEFQFQIDEHELAVTEVDGTDVVPQSYHRININPAQRYSVVVNTNATNADAFWLRARMITVCFTEPPKTLQPDVYAVVRYKANTPEKPRSIDWAEKLESECRDLNTSSLTPVDVIPAPAKADAFFYFRSNFEIGAYRLSRGFFDGSSWRAPARSATLLTATDGVKDGNVSFTAAEQPDHGLGSAWINDKAFHRPKELVVQTTGIQVVDILISNFDDGNHPLHLHGYKYFVLAQGHGYPPMLNKMDGVTRENIQPLYHQLDLSNPLRRDTASVEAFGWILLRIVADNPGAWAFHCHVGWHTEAGLLMQFLTRTGELAHLDVRESHRALCAAEGVERGMGPDDEDYRDFAK